ncbi:MAG TPA: two-component regulator propeller domain-containing protein [Verrucomicrobiae bacterium]|nr:two-component regulator propeller domain-containing protein [Verrucomicrobiae bacterium]
MLFPKALLAAVLALGVFAAAARADESPFIVDSWNNQQGLPQSSVWSVIQSKDGYLWLGTFNGLVRFDGNRFKVFTPNNTPGLDSGKIVSLFEDSETNLWIATDTAGVAMERDGKIQNFQIGRSGHEGRVTSICQDNSGGVWLYTADARLAHFKNGKMEIVPFNIGSLPICRMITAETNGTIWIAEFSSAFSALFSVRPESFHPPAVAFQQQLAARRVDYILGSKNGGTWRLVNGRVQKWNATQLEKDLCAYPWANVTVTSACEDKDGNLIVGTIGEGVFWFDADGNYQRIDSQLSSPDVLSLCMDDAGNLWVGTDGGGLDRVKRKIFSSPKNLRDGTAQSISADASGSLWIAFNGAGATHWTTNSVTDYFRIGNYPNAWTTLVDDRQNVWLGTRDEGLFQFRTNHFERIIAPPVLNGQIFALYEDHQGQIWAGSRNGLANWDGTRWKIFTAGDGLSENIVRAIAEDSNDDLWIGTESGGLNFFKDGKFSSIHISETGLPGNDISSLFVDKNGVLWVGTAFHGLASFYKDKWNRFSTDDGLASDSVDYIVEDAAGDLWIGSNDGLTRVKKSLSKILSCRTFTESDGLPTRECSAGAQPAAARSRNGTLFFPTTRGVVSINPAQIKTNLQPPQIVIESVRVDGREQKANPFSAGSPDEVIIPPGHEQLEIDYTALNFSAPRAVHFKYRLEGRDTAWTDGDTRVAFYPGLAYGHYRFRVIACNEDGVWNDTGSILEITVQPQFWQTLWFRTAVILFLLGAIVGIVRYISTQKLQRELQRHKQKEALERERARIARDLHDQLGANLTQVALLGEMAEADKDFPDEIESHAKQISQTARETTHALDEIVWAINPSNDTLEGLASYACKYAQEYLALANIRYRVDVPAQLPARPIPPEVRHNVFLAFKEAVNNVVKHSEATETRIRLFVRPREFIFEIEDNGKGISSLKGKEHRSGLRNMRKRMEDIQGQFEIAAGKENGTIIKLTVPIA